MVELGCGMGLPSIAAARAGASVLATDGMCRGSRPGHAQRRAERRERRDGGGGLGGAGGARRTGRRSTSCWPSDVLYERQSVGRLLSLLPRLAPEAWITDPGRAASAVFFDHAWERWDVEALRDGVITLHRVRSRRPGCETRRLWTRSRQLTDGSSMSSRSTRPPASRCRTSSSPRRLARRTLQIVAALAVVGLVLLLAPGLGEVRDLLAEAQPEWIALAVAFEALSCVSYVLMFRPIFCQQHALAHELGDRPGRARRRLDRAGERSRRPRPRRLDPAARAACRRSGSPAARWPSSSSRAR